MKFEDFAKQELDRMREESSGFKTVAEVTIAMGYQAYVEGQGMTKIFTYDKEDDATKAKAEARAYLEKHNPQGWPQGGILLIVNGSDVPSHPDGKFEYGDREQFVPMFQSIASLDKFKPEIREKYKELSAGRAIKLPADLFVEKLKGLGISEKTFWAQLSQQVDWYAEARGKKVTRNKGTEDEKEVAVRIFVIEKTYPNREAALADLGQAAAPDEQFSETAKKNYPDLSQLKNLADEISTWLDKIAKGTPFSDQHPLPEPNTHPNRVKYIADLYSVEPSDIMKLATDTPF
jgi:hypothetical protein